MDKQKLGPLQKEFVRALRSGDFPQAKGMLFRVRRGSNVLGHCCLGVAVCVAAANGVRVREMWQDSRLYVNGTGATLPDVVQAVMMFLGDGGALKTEMLIGTGQYDSLADANDSGVKFAVIADFIEAHPEAVFTGAA